MLPKYILSIENYYYIKEVILLTVEQIKKDFQEINFTLTFDDESSLSPYHQLYQQILPCINALLNKNKSSLYALLYRVDVSEKSIRNLFK
jgi:hypothetical protein